MAVTPDPSTHLQSLDGKTALVTGASRGIGLAIATALAARGVRVALLARPGAQLDQAAAGLGARAIAVPADITQPDAVRAAFVRLEATFGRLDILVNNAGLSGLHRVEKVSDAALRREVDTNFLGLVYCTRAAIPLLRAAGGGDIVNVSSNAATEPYPFLSIYAATKAAVELFSVALRREVEADGTRVIVLRCGPTWTNFHEQWDPVETAEALQVWTAGGYAGMRRCLDPAAVGETVALLLTVPRQACPDLVELDPTGHAPSSPPSRP